MLTILFGTVEYFEREILNEILDNHTNELSEEENISNAYSKLNDELLVNFICSEKLRLECRQNLKKAYEKIMGK